MKIETEADQVLDRVVKAVGTGAHVYVPLTWLGQPVKILLLKNIAGVNKE